MKIIFTEDGYQMTETFIKLLVVKEYALHLYKYFVSWIFAIHNLPLLKEFLLTFWRLFIINEIFPNKQMKYFLTFLPLYWVFSDCRASGVEHWADRVYDSES